MNRIVVFVGTILLAGVSLVRAAGPATQPVEMVHVGGDMVIARDWTAEQMATELAADVKVVDYTGKSGKHTYKCVQVLSVLKACGLDVELNMGAKVDPKIKNAQLRLIVEARGRDGYMVVFSMGELLSDIGNRAVWLALDSDGKPLSEGEGPVRLLAPEDGMPARSVHQLSDITVVNEAK